MSRWIYGFDLELLCAWYQPCPICHRCMNAAAHLYERCHNCMFTQEGATCRHNDAKRTFAIRRRNFRLHFDEGVETELRELLKGGQA